MVDYMYYTKGSAWGEPAPEKLGYRQQPTRRGSEGCGRPHHEGESRCWKTGGADGELN